MIKNKVIDEQVSKYMRELNKKSWAVRKQRLSSDWFSEQGKKGAAKRWSKAKDGNAGE